MGTQGNVEATNDDGQTPLLLAVDVGDEAPVRMLVNKRADINATDDDGNTALKIAEREGHSKTMQILKTELPGKATLGVDKAKGSTSTGGDGRSGIPTVAPDGHSQSSTGLSVKRWAVTESTELDATDGDLCTEVLFPPDGRMLALQLAGISHTHILWDLKAGVRIRTMEEASWEYNIVIYFPKWEIIVAAINSTLRFWNANTMKLIRTFDCGISGHICAAA
jgi:WD40 repeat protein